jgi:hypothetical protein
MGQTTSDRSRRRSLATLRKPEINRSRFSFIRPGGFLALGQGGNARNGDPGKKEYNPIAGRLMAATAGSGISTELPRLPADLGRSTAYDEGISVKRSVVQIRRAFLRVAGPLMDPTLPNEAGQMLGGSPSIPVQLAVIDAAKNLEPANWPSNSSIH